MPSVDVTLHVYKLSAVTHGPTVDWWTSQVLPSLGMGAYHTSLHVHNQYHTFAAHQGIITNRNDTIDPTASFVTAIPLGQWNGTKRELQRMLQQLSVFYFTSTAYHLILRNCNHFTLTLATALLGDDLPTYPAYINRLATTSAALLPSDPQITPCRPAAEAQHVRTGIDPQFEKTSAVPVMLTSSKDSSKGKSKKGKKKELTEQQKKALAFIRTK